MARDSRPSRLRFSLVRTHEPGRLVARRVDHDINDHDITGHDITGHDITGHDVTGHDITGHDEPRSARKRQQRVP
jgi:hypothetical protein